jgi:hypothetical protein
MTEYSNSDDLIENLVGLLSSGDAVGFRDTDPLVQKLQTQLGITMPKQQGASVYLPLDDPDKGLALERQSDELLFLKLIEPPDRQSGSYFPVLATRRPEPLPSRTVTMVFDGDGNVRLESGDQDSAGKTVFDEAIDADALLDHAEQALDRASNSLDELSAIKSKL